MQDEIKKLQSDLRKMSKRSPSPDDEEAGSKKRKRAAGPSLLQLEREKYKRGARSVKGKGKREADDDDEDDIMASLNSFRSKIAQAAADGDDAQDETDEGYAGEVIDDLNGGDEGWLGHRLRFRKDVTLDRHTVDEYEVVDPLAKSSMTLDEIRQRKDQRSRKYAEDEPRRRDGGGGDSERRQHGQRQRQRSPGPSRGDVRSDWRSQRVHQ